MKYTSDKMQMQMKNNVTCISLYTVQSGANEVQQSTTKQHQIRTGTNKKKNSRPIQRFILTVNFMLLFMTVYKTGFKQADPIFTSYQSHGWFHQETV